MIKLIGFFFFFFSVKAKLFLNAEQHIPELPKLDISIPDHNSHESRDKSETIRIEIQSSDQSHLRNPEMTKTKNTFETSISWVFSASKQSTRKIQASKPSETHKYR
jgi:hypothetical protein